MTVDLGEDSSTQPSTELVFNPKSQYETPRIITVENASDLILAFRYDLDEFLPQDLHLAD